MAWLSTSTFNQGVGLAIWAATSAQPAIAAGGVEYSMVVAGQGCSNVHKTLQMVTSVDDCAQLVCSDGECGSYFLSMQPPNPENAGAAMSCACLAPGQTCMQVDEQGAFLHEISESAECEMGKHDDCFTTLYETEHFGGWTVTLPEGFFGTEELLAQGAADNDVSALYVHGQGCLATLYEHGNFSGWTATFVEGSYTAEEMVQQGAVNDATSAIVVRHTSAATMHPVIDGASSQTQTVDTGSDAGLGAAVSGTSQSVDSGSGAEAAVGGLAPAVPSAPPPAPPAQPKVATPRFPTRQYESEEHHADGLNGLNVLCDPVTRENCEQQDIDFLEGVEREFGSVASSSGQKRWRSRVKGELKRIDAAYPLVREHFRAGVARRVALLHKLLEQTQEESPSSGGEL